MAENISGMSRMTVSRAVSLLSAAYISLIKSSMPFRTFPSVMMWGSPGVGKSQGVRQVAKKIPIKRLSSPTETHISPMNPLQWESPFCG